MIDDRDEEKIEVSRNELEKLIDQRVEQKLQTLETEDTSSEKTSEQRNNDSSFSRRQFLKTLGLGAGGLALTSTAAGAGLLSGTTIGGNTAWHQGNDGPGSGLDADTVDGEAPPFYSDSDAVTAINSDSDHGSTASHNYFSGSHNDLSNVGSSDHHTKYSDSDAQSAVDGANIDITGDADTVDGYHFNVGSSKPGSPASGTLFYDTDQQGVWYYNGSNWVGISGNAVAIPDSGVTQAQRYWPADDGSGSTIAEDRLGDDSTGFTGSWTSGPYIGGTAPVYDGADDWDEADYAFDANFQGFGFFVAIEPHSGGQGTDRYFADPSGGSGGNGWEPGPAGRVATDDGLEFFTKDGTSTVTLQSSSITHDTLHTVGASYNPNNEAVLYLDGSRVDSASVGTPENNEPTTMNWGSSRNNDRTFDGVIDARLHLQGDYWTDSEHQEIHDQYMALI